jgi:zinc protease
LFIAFVMVVAVTALAGEPPLFDYREITLDNGLRVITLEDFSCPIVAVELWYHVGSKDEDLQRQGFAHMFEHMMFRGTDRLGPTDHFDFIRRTGGTCNAYTNFDNTTYHELLPAQQLELALYLEAERMGFLKIDQESFDTERKVVEEERRLGMNQPYGQLVEHVLAEVFKQHPYRWSPIGSIPHLRSAAVPELRAFWTKYYVPNNATLVIVGAVKHAQAQELARQYFGPIPRYPEPPRVTVQEPQPTAARTVTFKEASAPAPLVGVLFRTVPVAHPDYIPLQLLGTILGSGDSSRLYRELVAERQLAPFALAAAFSLEQDGLFAAAAVLPPFGGKPDQVLSAIQTQLERLRNEPVTEHELTKARNQMLSGLVTENLSIQSKASALGSAAVIEGDVGRVNRRMEEVRRATAEDLQRVAQTYLAPERGLTGKVEQNLLGTLGNWLGFKKAEEEAPITAEPETNPPPPGRPNLARTDDMRQDPPIAAMLEYDPTPKCDTAALPNGLKLMVVENHEVPFVSVQLGLRDGARTESKVGAASMALSMLTKGTAQHSEGELADELETYAISLGAGGDMDDSRVSVGCLTEHVERALRLMAEVVRQPTFPPEEFKKLRKQVRTGLAISTAEPSYMADREMRRRLYGEHPYARTPAGELADLEVLKVEDAQTWWQRFARPDRAVLIFAGDIDLKRATALATQCFGDWQAEGPAPEVKLPPMPPPAPTQVYLVDRPAPQVQIRVGQLGITRQHPGYFVSRVVNGYFGGSFSSRLNDTIRVKLGLTYGAHGGYSVQHLAGEFNVGTFTKTDEAVRTVRVIFDELKRLRDEPPNDKELNDTKSYTLGSFPAQRETPQQVAEALWLLEAEGLPADYYKKLLNGVAGTKPEGCTGLVAQTIDPARMVVVAVGPATELRAALEEIAPVTVVVPETGPETAPAPADDEQ